MCGSNQLYTSAQQNGCFLELLIGGVVSKSLDTKTTIVTTSTAGNIKLISAYPSATVLISDADAQAMGYADKEAFLVFYNAIAASCSGGSTPPPTPPQLVTVTFTDNIDNGQTLVQTGVATGIVLGGKYTVIPVTDLAPLYAAGLIVSFDIVTNGLLTVTVKNLGDDDAVVIPPLSFNIYSL